jgi:hypothetical protein
MVKNTLIPGHHNRLVIWPPFVVNWSSFVFNNESGQSDKQPTTALAQLFQAGPGAGTAVLGGMAAGLVSLGIPLMIGWLAEKFYGGADLFFEVPFNHSR